MNVLFDADLILAAYLNQGEWEEDIMLLWDVMESGQIEAYITDSGFEKFIWVVNKCKDRQKAEQVFIDLQEVVNILAIEDELYQQALELNLLDYDSALEIVTAIVNKIGAIVTLKPQNFDTSNIQILSIQDLLERQILESSCSLISQEKRISLLQWLDNDFSDAIEAGWQTFEEFIVKQHKRQSKIAMRSRDFSKNTIERIKKINFDNTSCLGIIMSIISIESKEINIVVKIASIINNLLEEKVILILLDNQGEECTRIESKHGDNYIQIDFVAAIHEKFSIMIIYQDYKFIENFVV